MAAEARILLWINVLGGAAVLGSYAHGIATHPGEGMKLWGDVPGGLRPFYGVWMWVAAASYLVFASFLLFRVEPPKVAVGRFGYEIFYWIFLLILVPSALWMPLTFRMLEAPGPRLWLAISVTLALVGLGSLALLAALLRLQPAEPALHHRLAVIAAAAFSVQTALLDALVWPAFFPR